MTRFSRCISLLLTLSMAAAAVRGKGKDAFMLDEGVRKDYALTIESPDMSFTGICVMRQMSDTVAGTVVNEFGLKAFDFIYLMSKRKIKLKNVVKFLDRWYIKSTLKGDLKYLLGGSKPSHRGLDIGADSTVRLANRRRGLTYIFTPIKQPSIK